MFAALTAKQSGRFVFRQSPQKNTLLSPNFLAMKISSLSQSAVFVLVAVQVSRFAFNANQLPSARLTAGAVNISNRPNMDEQKAMNIKAEWLNPDIAVIGAGSRYG